ncbi:TonB-dependent receptor [Steroidobacter sp. S1-65]|uniref:TonB-dependent receptor n=1 Tax=Steroidobacter gossypii TaxID=2805490 RepID=A0ABS1WV86_9GAMM|nr:TonB-dependent receptor [Steroidobacter gossypii]MBM0104881.1 TonB-dependent receptor [Steroidobacter gossypii]
MRSRIAIGTLISVTTGLLAIPTQAQEARGLEEIIVTAQKRAESIQDVPIAVSAFSADALEEQRLDGAYNLQNAVPNLVFSGGTGSTPNFNIRGVGSANGTGSTGDSGVLPHHNNVPLTVSRIGVADFYDVERIEVLRGPQGTLYGRNATGGVLNVITARPNLAEFNASTTLEYADYDTRKAKGHVNVPIGDIFGLRIAGNYLQRDGYTENVATGNDIDSRDLWSARATLAFQPTDNFRAYVLYERFEEDDSRNGGGRTLCIKDPGPEMVGSTPVNNAVARNYLSRGCLQGSIYQPSAFGTVNSVATFGGMFSNVLGLTTGDTFAGQMGDPDLRRSSAYRDPSYDATNDLLELETQWDIADGLTLSFLASYTSDEALSASGSQQSEIGFNNTAVTPGGVFNDPQGGPGAGVRTLVYSTNDDIQRTGELRLQSSFDGAVNFNVGVFALNLDRSTTTFTSTNATNAFHRASGNASFYDATPGIPVNGLGHNYFFVYTPYQLESQAAFGELYWNVTDTVKLTVGARYTEDEKSRIYYPVNLLAPAGQGGVVGAPGWNESRVVPEQLESNATTGRVTLDWAATADTLVYLTLSRGYKAGGFNTPTTMGSAAPYDAETVDAVEIGAKNSLFDGRVTLNVTGFMYDYQDYQFSKLDGFASLVDNLDAEVRGIEIEAVWSPIDALRLNAQIGYLDSEITAGSSVDPFDRTQGDPSLHYAKSLEGGCVVDRAGLERVIAAVNAGALPAAALAPLPNAGLCGSAALNSGFGLNRSAGVPVNLAGNQLPGAPEWTASFGAQYTLALGNDWQATLRADYYRQAESYASHFNTPDYELNSWDNYNASLLFRNLAWDLDVQVYGKNLADDDVIVGLEVQSEQLGLTRNVQLLEPRLFGVAITKRW